MIEFSAKAAAQIASNGAMPNGAKIARIGAMKAAELRTAVGDVILRRLATASDPIFRVSILRTFHQTVMTTEDLACVPYDYPEGIWRGMGQVKTACAVGIK
jgi:hypothetical protein